MKVWSRSGGSAFNSQNQPKRSTWSALLIQYRARVPRINRRSFSRHVREITFVFASLLINPRVFHPVIDVSSHFVLFLSILFFLFLHFFPPFFPLFFFPRASFLLLPFVVCHGTSIPSIPGKIRVMQIVEGAARTDFPSDLVYSKGGLFQRVDHPPPPWRRESVA